MLQQTPGRTLGGHGAGVGGRFFLDSFGVLGPMGLGDSVGGRGLANLKSCIFSIFDTILFEGSKRNLRKTARMLI